ncbi:MAG TPA: hypothetical protein VM942_03105, partial [Acidimicrobiales bacterium]|nr:hypothetical protein [Acidimicrobiales bacterium]
MTELLSGVRRRLRLAWGVATAQWLAPAVVGAALALVLAGRMRPWAWPEATAVGLVAVAAVGLVIASLVVKVPMLVAARAADRGLGTGDVFATALEMETREAAGGLGAGAGSDGGPFGERVRARAADLAAGRRPSEAVPVRIDRRRLGVVAGLAVTTVALGLTANHQDDVRRRQEAEQQVLQTEADKLREAAEELRTATAPTPTQEELAQRLEELARELAAAPSLQRGQEALDAAARELAGQLSPNLLAQKAAVRGLDRSLASSPLPGAAAGGDAASQLRS